MTKFFKKYCSKKKSKHSLNKVLNMLFEEGKAKEILENLRKTQVLHNERMNFYAE